MLVHTKSLCWFVSNQVQYDIARELEKTMKHESDGDTNSSWSARYSYQMIHKGTGGLGNKWTSGNYPNYSIVEIGQNTEKSPEET